MNHGDTEAQRKKLDDLNAKVIGLCIETHRQLAISHFSVSPCLCGSIKLSCPVSPWNYATVDDEPSRWHELELKEGNL
jgi:hypothetical protein